MQFVTKIESLRILADLPAIELRAGSGLTELQVSIEDCLDRSAAIAKLFVKLIGTEQAPFLWIREFGIWPSLENWPFFNILRSNSNELRPLHETPGHMFAADEQEALVSYLQLVIVFGWGGVLLGLNNRHRLIVSHDSWASLRSGSAMPFLIKTVIDFGLPYRTTGRPRDTLTALGLSRDGEILSPQRP